MDTGPARPGLRLVAAVLLLAALAGLGSLVFVRFVTRDPSNVAMPPGAPPGLERAAERACVFGYRIGEETSHLDAVEERGVGQYAVRCAQGPLHIPAWWVDLTCVDGDWHGPRGYGPNGSRGPYGVPCRSG